MNISFQRRFLFLSPGTAGRIFRFRAAFFSCFFCAAAFLACAFGTEPQTHLPQQLHLVPVKSYPHDRDSFCQGLLCVSENGTPFFYESAGLYGRSAIKKTALTGETLRRENLPRRYFGEGAALLDGKIYQITWRENTCFVYDAETFRLLKKMTYKGEGWGLTDNGAELVMSDGSDTITFRDPGTFKPVRQLRVFWTNPKTNEQVPLPRLNELEWIDGEIWANIFETTKIARIDPDSGRVIQLLDFARYVPDECQNDPQRVLNGIAWDSDARRLFITGKEWPVLYELVIENDPLKKTP